MSAQDRPSKTDSYLALLTLYASGDRDGAVSQLLELDAHETRAVVRTVLEDVEAEILALRGLDGFRKVTVPHQGALTGLRRRRLTTLKLCLLVHTEAGLRLAAPHPQLLIAEDVVDRLWQLNRDFERLGPLAVSGAGPQPDVVTWQQVRLFVRDWYLLVASQLATLGHLGSLRTHISGGLERFEDDPELLLARGSVYEVDAEASVVDRSLVRRVYTPQFIAHWRRRLYDARDDYRRAYERQPDLFEARLRWGRMHGLLGETARAREALDAVTRSEAHPFLRYLAWIFLAELSEQAGNRVNAQREYQAALGFWPGAQAPKLALSRLCMASGDDACGRAWLRRSLGEVAQSRTDPWWDYLQGQAWLGDERLARFRQRGLAP